MDVAIVTGAATGIGLAVSRRLIGLGFRVYGLGGNYSELSFSHDYFIPTPCDLADLDVVKSKMDAILEREGDVYIIVNNAKVYPSKEFADPVNLAEYERVLKINLLCPVALARLALPSLVKLGGYIINIAPSSCETSRGGPIGAASAGGLHWMGESLFEELRDSGVRVTTLFPQMNRFRSPDSLPVPKHSPQSVIDPECIADAIAQIVQHRDGNLISEMTIRPQRTKEMVVLPPLLVPYPKPEKPKPEEKAPTTASMAQTREAIKKASEKAERKRHEQAKQKARREERNRQRESRREKSKVIAKDNAAQTSAEENKREDTKGQTHIREKTQESRKQTPVEESPRQEQSPTSGGSPRKRRSRLRRGRRVERSPFPKQELGDMPKPPMKSKPDPKPAEPTPGPVAVGDQQVDKKTQSPAVVPSSWISQPESGADSKKAMPSKKSKRPKRAAIIARSSRDIEKVDKETEKAVKPVESPQSVEKSESTSQEASTTPEAVETPQKKSPREASAKKTGVRKTSAKKASARKSTAKKTSRKTAARKTTAKKSAARKTVAKKTARKTAAKRAARKKPAKSDSDS